MSISEQKRLVNSQLSGAPPGLVNRRIRNDAKPCTAARFRNRWVLSALHILSWPLTGQYAGLHQRWSAPPILISWIARQGEIRLQAASDRFRTTCSSHASGPVTEIAVYQLAFVGSSRLIHSHGCIHLSQLFKPRRSLPLAPSCPFAYSRRSLDRAHFEDKPTYTYAHYYPHCLINVIANMVTISKFASRLVSPISNPNPPNTSLRDISTPFTPCNPLSTPNLILRPQLTSQAIVAAALIGPTTAAAGEPQTIPVSPQCNQPNNELTIFPEAFSPAIPPPSTPVTMQPDCCYEHSYDLGNQLCACKAWDAWCAGRYSTCCGDARPCTEYCICIPPERFCGHPDNEFEQVCDDPYEGEGDVTWAMDLGMNEAPECPS